MTGRRALIAIQVLAITLIMFSVGFDLVHGVHHWWPHWAIVSVTIPLFVLNVWKTAKLLPID